MEFNYFLCIQSLVSDNAYSSEFLKTEIEIVEFNAVKGASQPVKYNKINSLIDVFYELDNNSIHKKYYKLKNNKILLKELKLEVLTLYIFMAT